MQNGFLKGINVDVTILPSVTSDEPFDGFDTYFCSAVAVWESHGAEVVVYSPVTKEYRQGYRKWQRCFLRL